MNLTTKERLGYLFSWKNIIISTNGCVTFYEENVLTQEVCWATDTVFCASYFLKGHLCNPSQFILKKEESYQVELYFHPFATKISLSHIEKWLIIINSFMTHQIFPVMGQAVSEAPGVQEVLKHVSISERLSRLASKHTKNP